MFCERNRTSRSFTHAMTLKSRRPTSDSRRLSLLLMVFLATCQASCGHSSDDDSLPTDLSQDDHFELDETVAGHLSSNLKSDDLQEASLTPTLPSSQGLPDESSGETTEPSTTTLIAKEDVEEGKNRTDSTTNASANKISCDPRQLAEGEVSIIELFLHLHVFLKTHI